MRLKLDENIPRSAASALAALGHDVHTVVDEGIQGADDATVWRIAQSEHRFVVTQDIRFVAEQVIPSQPHAGILIVRTRLPGRLAVHNRVLALFRQEQVEGWIGAIVVASDVKVRVLPRKGPEA